MTVWRWWREFMPSSWFRSTVALLLPAFALAGQMALEPWMPQRPFVFMYPAAFFAAWIAGPRVGFVATLLTAALVDWFVLEPRLTWNLADRGNLIALFVFVCMGALFARLQGNLRMHASRARYSEALSRSEQRWKFALEGSGQGVWDWDLESGLVYQTAASRAILGYDGEHTGPFGDVLREAHPDDLDTLTDAVESLRRGSSGDLRVEHRVRRRDGSYVWVETRGRVVERDPEGRPSRMLGTLADVTLRKEADATLRGYAERLEVEVGRRTAEVEAARAAAAESERYIRTLFKEATVGIATTRVSDGSIVTANPAFAGIVGRTEEALAELTWADLIHPEDLEASYRAVQALSSGEVESYKTLERYVRADGTIVYGDVHVTRVASSAQGERHNLVMVTDVTDRHLAESSRVEATQRLDLAMHAARLGVWSVDVTTGDIYSDARSRAIYEVPDGCEGRELREYCVSVLLPEDHERLRALRATARLGDGPTELNLRLQLAGGRTRYVNSVAAPSFAPDGRLLRVTGVDRDATAEHELVERLRVTIGELDVANRRLEEAKLKLEATVLERTADLLDAQRIGVIGSWRWDRSSDFFDGSPELYRIFGRSSLPPFAQMAGVVMTPASWMRLSQSLQRALHSAEAHGMDVEALRADGSTFWARLRAEVETDEDGVVRGLRGTLQDVSEERRRLDEIRALNAEMAGVHDSLWLAKQAAEDANRAKTQFLAAVSHELRTPLNAVIGFSSLLQTGAAGEVNDEQRRQLARIQQAGEAQLKLVSELLEVTQADTAALGLNLAWVPVDGVLSEVTAVHRAAAAAKRLRLRTSPVEAGLLVRADASRLKQVLSHLVSNAVKFTDRGEVALGAARIGERVRFAVIDTGPGLAAGHAERLFRPFSQPHVSAGRTYEGAGIGLALCRRLVESMQGAIGVDPAPTSGCAFWVDLPVAEDGERVSPLASDAELEVTRPG